MGATIDIKDPDEKKRVREELANGLMQTWGANLEAQIGDGPFFGGAELQVVDLKLFVMTHFFVRAGADHIPGDVFKAFPKLTALYNAVKAHPKIIAYYEARKAAS
ncbi:MAG: glutathione S-transferase family protein [Nannocystaceae bacterium]